MVTNAFGTINTNVIMGVQEALTLLVTNHPYLHAIGKDLSTDEAKQGDTIIAKVHDVSDAVVFDPTVGINPGNISTLQYPVTLDTVIQVGIQLNVTELTTKDPTGTILAKIAKPMAKKLANAIMANMMSKFTLASTPNKTISTLANLNRETIIELRKQLILRKATDPFVILGNPDFYATVSADETIAKSSSNYNTDLIQTGTISKVHGFDIVEYTEVPTIDNTIAIACNTQGMIFASRALTNLQQLSGAPSVAQVVNVVEPVSGLTAQLHSFYNPQSMNYTLALIMLFGTSIGNSDCVQRLTTA
jgi:hypothetical protein